MRDINLQSRTLGINFTSGGMASALLWAPRAGSVGLKPGDGAVVPMEACGYGYWKLDQAPIAPGERYFFVVDGRKHFPDPASLYQPEGVHGPSEAVDLQEYIWSDASWNSPRPDQWVIYEIHTGTFSAQGNFEGIIEKLDYLGNLGVTVIELMPVVQFPGERNWGYDGVFPFAVHSYYGSAGGLQELVDACHARGLALVLDVVYNHLGPEGNYMGEYAPYFTDKYRTPWGKAINLDDAWCDGVRRFIIENALMWLRDFHVDGLRLDAVHALADFSPSHIVKEICLHVDELNRALGRRHFVIGECDLNDVRYINPFEKGGYGLNAQWCDEYHHALHAAVTGERNGYYTDFGNWDQLVKSMNHGYVYDGLYSAYRKKTFGTSTENQPASRFVVYSQNHDQVGNRARGERLSQLLPFELLKVVAGAILLSPFTPLLFMGEEYGELSPFLYFTSHQDPDLARSVREGRKREFAGLLKGEDPPDPQNRHTFLRSKMNWDLLGKARHRQLLSFYRALIHFRLENDMYHPVRRERFKAIRCEAKEMIILHYASRHDQVMIIMNFGAETLSIDTGFNRSGKMEVAIHSKQVYWGGNIDEPPETLINGGNMKSPGQSLIVLSSSL